MIKISSLPLVKDKADLNKSNIAETVEFASFEEFHTFIQRNTWCPATFTHGNRKNNEVKAIEVLALDFDKDMTAVEAMSIADDLNLQYSLTYSKSHQIPKNNEPPCDRHRLCFLLKEPITNIDTFNATWQYMYKMFGEKADKSCKDPARLFFASPKHEPVLKLNGNLLDPITAIPLPTKEKTKTLKFGKNAPALLNCNVMSFLKQAHTGLTGEWNSRLYQATSDMIRGGMPEELVETLIATVAPSELTKSDLDTIQSAIKNGKSKDLLRELTTAVADLTIAQAVEALDEYFSNRFLVCEDANGSRNLTVENLGNNVVRAVSHDKLAAVAGKFLVKDHHMYFSAAKLNNHVDNWAIHSQAISIPKTLTALDDPSPAFNKLDIEIQPGVCPHFDELMSRCSSNEALMAFIWSIFEPESYMQQYVWIHGDGGDGKSSLSTFLQKLLGTGFTSLDATKAHDQHFTSQLIGKRLGVFEDSNCTKMVQSGAWKELTGGGSVSVRQLYKDPYSIKLDCKFIILSNKLPVITGASSDLRRLILIEVEPLPMSTKVNTRYVDELYAERAAILHKCRDVYNRIATNHGVIEFDRADTKSLSVEYDTPMQIIFDKFFILDNNGSVDRFKFYNITKNQLKDYGVKFEDMKMWMQRDLGINMKRKRDTTIPYAGFKLKEGLE